MTLSSKGKHISKLQSSQKIVGHFPLRLRDEHHLRDHDEHRRQHVRLGLVRVGRVAAVGRRQCRVGKHELHCVVIKDNKIIYNFKVVQFFS